jgi:hypothetical protein
VVAVNTLVRSINVTAPDAGTVIVNSGGNAFFGDPGSDVSCSITTGTTVASVNILVTGGVNEGSSIATTRGFSVPKGSTTFKLVCTLLDGAATVNDAVLTAIFVPERF